MTEAPDARPRRAAPWRSRRRVDDARKKFIAVRCTAKEHADITEAASKAGYSVGAFLRASALGSAGPRAIRRPPIEKKELARLLGWLGKLGSNVNQLAHAFNRDRSSPSLSQLVTIRKDVTELRDALIKALGHGD